MDAKRLAIGSLVGAVVMTVLGFTLFELVFAWFFEARMLVTFRDAPIWWAAIASGVVHGALLTLVVGWAGAQSAVEGLKVGAVVGFLLWLGADLILYGVYEYATLAAVLADAVISAVPYGAAGGAIAAVAKAAPKTATAAV
jgi:hypothetical protein